MSVSTIQNQTITPAVYSQNEVSTTKHVPKEYSEFNSLDRIYVDPPVISRLNLEKQHSDMPEKIETKETQDLQDKKDPFAKVDFAAESSDFEASQVQNIDGDMKSSQANAQPKRVEELLFDSK